MLSKPFANICQGFVTAKLPYQCQNTLYVSICENWCQKMLQDMPEYIIVGQATFQGIRQSKCHNACLDTCRNIWPHHMSDNMSGNTTDNTSDNMPYNISDNVSEFRMDISEIRVHTCQQFYQQLILTMVNTQSKVFSFSVYIHIYIFIYTRVYTHIQHTLYIYMYIYST